MLSARAQFTPRSDLGRFVESNITPGVVAAVTAATRLVYDRSQELVPVDTGELKASGKQQIDQSGKTVVGRVTYDSPHAEYVEFGTGRRGAESAEAGDGPYDPNWAGMSPQSYIRAAVDESRGAILDLFKSNISLTGV